MFQIMYTDVTTMLAALLLFVHHYLVQHELFVLKKYNLKLLNNNIYLFIWKLGCKERSANVHIAYKRTMIRSNILKVSKILVKSEMLMINW